MKRNHAAWALLPVWIAASAACQSEVEDGPSGAGGGTGGSAGGEPSTTASQTVSSSSSSSGGNSCVLDESNLDGCVLQ
ncbi:MAG: hypothetical protein JNL21_31760 [Myxococcales bacterium]|nr:hypothetical protein [Myxococcales bacterium]